MSQVSESSSAAPPSNPPAAPTYAPPPRPPGPPPAGSADEYNRLKLNYRLPMPRPKVRGRVIDWHSHLIALRHAEGWFEAADHYGIDHFVTMCPLEEAVGLVRHWGKRISLIAIPQWGDTSPVWRDNWLRRMEAFYNLGSRIVKFHCAPGTMHTRGWRLHEEVAKPLFDFAMDRGMILMSHIGDPDTWYNAKYTDVAKYGSRDDHFAMWDELLTRYAPRPWVGAHLGGNPENLPRLALLLDKHKHVYLDLSATRWMVREVSKQRDAAREFVIKYQDRLLWGSDQVSRNDQNFDFLASRFWAHRKLWETAYNDQTNILDPDLPAENQPRLCGLALPDDVLQKIYRDNAVKLMATVGVNLE